MLPVVVVLIPQHIVAQSSLCVVRRVGKSLRAPNQNATSRMSCTADQRASRFTTRTVAAHQELNAPPSISIASSHSFVAPFRLELNSFHLIEPMALTKLRREIDSPPANRSPDDAADGGEEWGHGSGVGVRRDLGACSSGFWSLAPLGGGYPQLTVRGDTCTCLAFCFLP